MSATIDATGLTIQTFDAVLSEIVTAIGVAFGLTSVQVERIRTDVRSTLGQLARIEAERDVVAQEALLKVYNTLSIYTEGAALDRLTRLFGVTRRAAFPSRVVGTATGTATTVIPAGTRLRYAPEGTIWETAAEYTIGGGGTVEIAVLSEENEPHQVAVDPQTGFDDWQILDTVVGFNAFESTDQEIIGSPIETDASLRTRLTIEVFRRGQGPLKAIEASIAAVTGNTYRRVYDNRSLTTDANGLPGKSINAVVRGGASSEIAAAIFAARPAGAELFAFDDASKVTVNVVDDYGFSHQVNYNTVADVNLWIRATLTTSTSEEAAPADLQDVVAELLLEQAPLIFDIGDDVLPWKLAGAIHAAGIPGIDNVVIELSLNGSSWSTAKRAITIRQQAVFDAARITVQED